MPATITDSLFGENSSVAIKAPVRTVSVGVNLQLTGLQTVGGVSLNEGDRILVKDQTNPIQNGIYNVSGSAWQRSGDFDGAYDVVQGTLVVVLVGNGQSLFFQLTSANPVRIGSSPLTFIPYTNPNLIYPQTLSEAQAGVVPVSPQFDTDGIGILNVLRYLNATQIADVLAGTATQDVSGPIQAANDFLEGRAIGAIATFGSFNAGAGYATPGVYTNVALTGGHGQFANANITVAGGQVSLVTFMGPGQAYQVGDVLSASNANLGGSGAGFSITVTALATGGKTAMPGGTLFFPGGRYYCGTTGLRIGDMVQWVGNQFTSTQLQWSNAFTGNCVTIGPDKSGFNGRSGFYAMGTVLDNIWIQPGTGTTGWAIYTTGAQQNVTIRNLWVTITKNSGIFLQDHLGSTYIKVENVYILPQSTPIAANLVGIHCDGPACIELNRVSMNGTTATPLLRGVEYVGGGLLITDFQCELTATHIDIAGTAGENPVSIDNATLNLSGGGVQGIWIHAGFTGTLFARNVDCGPFGLLLRNDNTGEQRTVPANGAILNYVWSGTLTDVSIFQNALIIPTLTQVNPPASTVLNVEINSAFDINVANNSAFSIAAPEIGASAMPATGRTGQRLLIKVRNISGVAMGAVTWNAIFKMSAWGNPANANSRSIEFQWNGTNWVQLWQSGVDVPN